MNFVPSSAPSYGNEETDHLNNSEFFQLRAWTGVMVHTYNFIIWELEAGGSELRGEKKSFLPTPVVKRSNIRQLSKITFGV